MNVVSFGGGTNSTAMIIGMYLHKIPIDLILFADTGGEQPHTYEFIETFNAWLEKHGLPKIVSVEYHDKDGNRLTDFISIKVRGPLAERCAEFAWKGCKLAASGDFETITFADEPERQPGFLIKATEVEFLSPRRVEESAVSMPADGMDEAAA